MIKKEAGSGSQASKQNSPPKNTAKTKRILKNIFFPSLNFAQWTIKRIKRVATAKEIIKFQKETGGRVIFSISKTDFILKAVAIPKNKVKENKKASTTKTFQGF